jgi:hypothetical protein
MDLASQIIAVTSETWSEGRAESILEGMAKGMLKEKEATAKN